MSAQSPVQAPQNLTTTITQVPTQVVETPQPTIPAPVLTKQTTVGVSGNLVNLFGKQVPRKYVYIGIGVILSLILFYFWWSGRKESKDKKVIDKYKQEEDEYNTLYNRQQKNKMPPIDPELMAQFLAMQNK
jgi:hypothetical protein